MSTPIMPDLSNIGALLDAAGISAGEDDVQRVPGGTINTTFRIRQEGSPSLYLRIAPPDAMVEAGPSWMTAHGLRRELAVIGTLEPIEDVLARTVHADWTRDVIDRDWVVQTEVPGRSWGDIQAELTTGQNDELWRQLGEITRAIHDVTGKEFGPPEEGFGHGSWSELVRWDVTGFLVDAQRYGIDVDPFERLGELVNSSVDVLDEVREPRLIHSDLHRRHVFVQRDRRGDVRISGLIDLEFARFADPYSESVFVMAAMEGGEDPGITAFCGAYGCEQPSRHARHRTVIYQLTALGWTVMDLHRRARQDLIPDVLGTMAELLDDVEGFT